MSAAKPLLIELGTEELPPKALDELATAFTRGICDGLARRGIEAGLDAARTYATPRRLAVLIPEVAKAQPEQTIERRGPAVSRRSRCRRPTRQGAARFCAVLRRRGRSARAVGNRQGRVVRLSIGQAGPTGGRAVAGDRRRGAQGTADSPADALERPRLQLRTPCALVGDAAWLGDRRWSGTGLDRRPQIARSPLHASTADSRGGCGELGGCDARGQGAG